MNLGVLVLGWVIYFFIHSLMASTAFKQRIAKIAGNGLRYYRLVYVFISSIGLLFLLMLNASINSTPYFNSGGVVRYTSLVFTAFGVIVIRAAFKEYNFSAFIGTSHANSDSLSANGILAKVRHPIYLGTILLVIGFFLFIPNLLTLISAMCIFIYLPIGIYLEERKLISEFGEEYLAYKKRVPAIIPKLF